MRSECKTAVGAPCGCRDSIYCAARIFGIQLIYRSCQSAAGAAVRLKGIEPLESRGDGEQLACGIAAVCAEVGGGSVALGGERFPSVAFVACRGEQSSQRTAQACRYQSVVQHSRFVVCEQLARRPEFIGVFSAQCGIEYLLFIGDRHIRNIQLVALRNALYRPNNIRQRAAEAEQYGIVVFGVHRLKLGERENGHRAELPPSAVRFLRKAV